MRIHYTVNLNNDIHLLRQLLSIENVVFFQGTLENGTEFDSSYRRGPPFTFTIGVGNVRPFNYYLI